MKGGERNEPRKNHQEVFKRLKDEINKSPAVYPSAYYLQQPYNSGGERLAEEFFLPKVRGRVVVLWENPNRCPQATVPN